MDTTAISILGQQLKDFLINQFSPPPGARNRLGFLGTGIAVDPASFLSAGQFNPARVNTWLDIVVDPVGRINAETDQVESGLWTATALMEAIAAGATCLAPPESDDYKAFAKAKSVAMQNLGGDTTVNTAPLDWYDPAQIPKWADCSLQASSSSSTGATTGSGPPASSAGPGKPLWAWRTLQDASSLKIVTERLDPSEALHTVRASSTSMRPMQSRAMAFAAIPVATAFPVRAASQMLAVSPSIAASPVLAVRAAPIASFVETKAATVSSSHAMLFSQAITAAANEATTSSVHSNSLSLHLNYRVVSLSRAPWWNELMMLLDNWYVPSCGRASLIEESTPEKTLGVPVALILTSNVSITAKWSDSDRAAATSNTHLGPWALTSSNFTATDSAGEAILTIPGVTAIGCIYRELPPLPPKADPSLAAAH